MPAVVRLTGLEELLALLRAEGPLVQLIAGGTDLLVRPAPFGERRLLLDLTRIAALGGIGPGPDGGLRIGAAVTHAAIARSPLVSRQARALSLAAMSIGSAQIRARGTLGGNLANASPAADTAPALLCLDAEIRLVSAAGARGMPVAEFFRGPGQTALAPGELIESVVLPRRAGRTVAFFQKAGQRRGMCCSKASIAFLARVASDGRLSGVRVALGAVAPTPVLAPLAAEALEGERLTRAVVARAAEGARRAARPIDDLRSTADFRRQIVGALLTEGLLELERQIAVRASRARSRRRARSR